MKYKSAFFFILVVSLVGCVTSKPDNMINFRDYSDFTFLYPREAKARIERDNGSVAFATKSGPSLNMTKGDYLIEVYRNPPSETCNYMGVSSPSELRDSKKITIGYWGKVDEKYDGSFFPHCYTNNIFGEQMSVYSTSYILCAEKNGTEVMICIQQVTDDPVLANAIFDTFRWVE